MTRNVGYGFDQKFLDHDTGPGHPERRARLESILGGLNRYEHKKELLEVQPRRATDEEILLVHTEAHLARIKRTQGRPRQYLDPDTVTSEHSYDVACWAVGSVLELVKSVLTKKIDCGFAFVRPPGHHAEPDRAMGFCLFNNVAIGAAYAQKAFDLGKVLIIDFDVHHGNGTQEAFYTRPDVLYISTHQYPLYPGTGSFDEVGEKQGKGYTLNFPLPAGTGDDVYNKIFEEIIDPIAEQYAPELVLVSAGFDPYFADPLASMRLTASGFKGMARTILKMADKCSQGRTLFVLEGGYHLDGLRDSSLAVLDEMLGIDPAPFRWKESEQSNSILQKAHKEFSPYWNISKFD